MWTLDGPEGRESAKIKYEIVQYTRGRGLDIGCGTEKAFSHFIGYDSGHHFGKGAADIVGDASDLSIFADKSMNFIFSSHLLEHLEDYKAALAEWWRVIKPGGHLVIYLPHKDFYPNVGQEGANPDHKHDFIPQDIVDAMPDGFDLLTNEERNEGIEYSFLQIYRKENNKQRLESWKKRKPAKTAVVVRYGGFGDMLQMSSILPGLKAQGYHVTVNTTHSGQDIMKADPNIDAFMLQDKDQVPNAELHIYWRVMASKFDKFINLSESVEGTFLSLPGRTGHTWPQSVRHKLFNFNYMEHAHELAGVPLPPKVKFYPTAEEQSWAASEKRRIGGDKVILWTLAGSSLHKTWPGLDAIIARILIDYPDSRIVLSGDQFCTLLEQGWENEKRVVCTSGKWSIRKTLAFAQVADMVIGPETGVLNAVSDEPMPKVIFLSHSSHENLTKYWKNTAVMEPQDCACYPCHMMHYGVDHCEFNKEEGVAQCQLNITVDAVWKAVQQFLRRQK